MADKTSIEWTDATWNPIRGCSVVSEGCRNCYAMAVTARFSGEGQAYEGLAYRNESGAHWTGKVALVEKHLQDPLRWQRQRRIFVNSMSDLFHESIPDEWIDKIFAIMALAPQHTFQILTKRPQRMLEYFNKRENGFIDGADQWTEEFVYELYARNRGEIPQHLKDAGWLFDTYYSEDGKDSQFEYHGVLPLPNVWLGVSVEDQKTADERIPLLLQTPAAVRWLSCEPLLGAIDLKLNERRCDKTASAHDCNVVADFLQWVVVGGESGHRARPMHPQWARLLRHQCVAAGVPFFFKQWGSWGPFTQLPVPLVSRGKPIHWFDDSEIPSYLVGKKAAGRLLDGRTWDEFP